ncbi:MAG: DUF2884 domain-containing protein [Rhodanobacter sp.]
MKFHCIVSVLLAATLAAGCTNDGDHSSVGFGTTSFANGRIKVSDNAATVHVKGAPQAVIGTSGSLQIGHDVIATNPAQQALLRDYYRHAAAVREHGIATGKAGAAVAGQAISSVAKGLASGNTDNIDQEIDAKAARVELEARKICLDLVGVKAAQDALAAQLPAFNPYAHVIDASATSDCKTIEKP